MADIAPERTWTVGRERQNGVDEARRFAEVVVADCDSESRRATVMAVSEFAENLIKYSAANDRSVAGTIAISVAPDVIRVRVTNTVISSDDARYVCETISRVASADVRSLYQARLKELFQNPRLPRAQLGLLRVAFEGGFRLSCTFHAPLLEIVAERRRGDDS